MLHMYFEATDAALGANSQITALKCVHCQNLHVETRWRMPQWALLVSRLFPTLCGLIFVGHRLSYECFGQVCKGLVVLSAIEHIKLPFKTLCHENLAFLCQLTEVGGSWPGCYAWWRVFRVAYPGLFVDLLYLVHKSTFGHCSSLGHFMLAWMVLFEVP